MHGIGITVRNLMISILQIIHVLDVVNMVISRSFVPTMKAKREKQARNFKRRAKFEEPTLLGKIKMIHPLAHHQRKMKKPIYV